MSDTRDAYFRVYGLDPESAELQGSLRCRLMDTAPACRAALLMQLVPQRRWIDLFGCAASAPGAFELPPVILERESYADVLLRTARQWAHTSDSAVERVCQLVFQHAWFPPVFADRPQRDCDEAIGASNRRKAYYIKFQRDIYNHMGPMAGQFVIGRWPYWLIDAISGNDEDQLAQWLGLL